MDWISVKDELPPQNWPVIVKNGKTIVYSVSYHYKKWHYWDRKLHKVTHWKFSQDRRPSVNPKEMNSYFRRAEKYRNQMKKLSFTTRPIIGLFSPDNLTPQPISILIDEMENMWK